MSRHASLQFGHALFEFLDPGTRTCQNLGLNVELLSGNQLEMAQSLRQDIVKISAQILVRVYHPWRYQRDKSLGNLVDILPPHHGRHLELVSVKFRYKWESGTISELRQSL